MSETCAMRFGQKLRSERTRHKLSTQALGLICEVSRSYITLIENGKRLPGKKVLPKLALALNLEADIVVNWYLEELKEKLNSDTF